MNVFNGFSTAGCLVSEKYDGICAIWDGDRLTTRDGNVIHAPDWFVKDLPKTRLVGELWAGRGKFEHVLSVCMAKDSGTRWLEIKLMVFQCEANVDLGEFAEHVKWWNSTNVDKDMKSVVAKGGEGLVVKTPSGELFKHKPIETDDAIVIGHSAGKNSNAGRVGSLIVKDRKNREFSLGSGLCIEHRENPPAIGSVVEFSYQGRTKNGKPRFASFLRVRKEKGLSWEKVA